MNISELGNPYGSPIGQASAEERDQMVEIFNILRGMTVKDAAKILRMVQSDLVEISIVGAISV